MVLHPVENGIWNVTDALHLVDCQVINPLYNKRELKRVFDRGKGNANKMDETDEQ